MTEGRLLAILHVSLALVSCVSSSFRGDFTLFSPVGVPNHYEMIDPHVIGRSCASWQELLSLGLAHTDRPMVAEAVEQALAEAPGADALAMVDIRLTGGCYEVEGAAISTRPPP